MAWVAVEPNGDEYIFSEKPERKYFFHMSSTWSLYDIGDSIELPKYSIEKLIGRPLTWEDEPVEIK